MVSARIEMHYLLGIYRRQRDDGLYASLIKDETGQKTQQVAKLTDLMKRTRETRHCFTQRARLRKDAVEVRRVL